MNQELIQALRELEREKGISFETILAGLEDALASAYKSWKRGFGVEEEPDGTRAKLDPETGELRMWVQTLDEETSEVTSETEVDVPDEFMGRIAAQTAKHVIYQKLRDAERDMTYEEFSGREGDIVTGIIQQDSHRYTLLDLGKVEALLPQAEQVPSEPYRHGERLKAYIVEVRKTTKGPQIVVSRTHPGLLRKLFELEVPEIAQGLVEIKAVAREPGHRSKIAVVSHEPGVDPVGACVGAKGSRVRLVVNELRGEKIDVVQWIDDPSRFVANALAPAKVKEVRVDETTGTAQVIVPDYQLSLAIGKEGQNARLAAKLTGYRIDIKSESQMADEERSRREPKAKKEQTPAAEAGAPSPETVSEAGPASEEPSGDGSAPLPEGEARILEQAAEAPEVEVAAPGDASVPQVHGGAAAKATADERAEQPESSPSA
ncbi:MAG TPA: transcription termination factor NusA [Actinomycetota bacterium]|nr:transcription termination factor NusA [Actinomycetota bacterium]